MTTKQMILSALWRLIRVVAAQVLAFLITETANIQIPYFGLSLGAAINALAKFLRDKYKWDWLPI